MSLIERAIAASGEKPAARTPRREERPQESRATVADKKPADAASRKPLAETRPAARIKREDRVVRTPTSRPVVSEPEAGLPEDDFGYGQYEEEVRQQPDYDRQYSRNFELDLDWLEEQGFFTPDDGENRLALELRAIKRRLLRRLHFYRLDAEKRRRQTGRDRQRNTVLVTSTRPAEGKTFNAINLALSLAIEDNINVLLIDADVPRPKVFHHLGLKSGLGLTDRIVDPSIPVADLIRRERDYPLSVMSQGTHTGSPIDVFSRDEMSKFIDEVSLRYPDRIIIFDAPPVLATPEAVVLSKHVDEVVFVVEANETPEPAVATALDEILDNNSRVSLILNRCLAPEAASHYGSYEEYYNRPGTTKSSGKRRKRRR